MRCKKCFLIILSGLVAVAVIAYLLLASILVFAHCDFTQEHYDDALVSISLGEWMKVNSIASFIIFFILISRIDVREGELGYQRHKKLLYTILYGLYILFEVVWNSIGFVLFQNHYKDDCASAGLFNTIFTTALYYGIILFSFFTIFIAASFIRIRNRWRWRRQLDLIRSQTDSNIGQSLIQQLQENMDQSLNLFQRIDERIELTINTWY